MQQKLLINQTKNNQFQRWNLHNLRNTEKIFKYTKAVGDNLEQVLIAEDIEEEWQNIRNIILDAANDIRHVTRKPCNDWWDGECELMAKEKNKARVKWKTRNTRANSEALSQKRKEERVVWEENEMLVEKKSRGDRTSK
jgi:hypothetical protein